MSAFQPRPITDSVPLMWGCVQQSYSWNKYPPRGRGVLPRWVCLSKSGLISGTPKKAGTYMIIVRCRRRPTRTRPRQHKNSRSLSIRRSLSTRPEVLWVSQ